jgi:kinesin family protein C1
VEFELQTMPTPRGSISAPSGAAPQVLGSITHPNAINAPQDVPPPAAAKRPAKRKSVGNFGEAAAEFAVSQEPIAKRVSGKAGLEGAPFASKGAMRKSPAKPPKPAAARKAVKASPAPRAAKAAKPTAKALVTPAARGGAGACLNVKAALKRAAEVNSTQKKPQEEIAELRAALEVQQEDNADLTAKYEKLQQEKWMASKELARQQEEMSKGSVAVEEQTEALRAELTAEREAHRLETEALHAERAAHNATSEQLLALETSLAESENLASGLGTAKAALEAALSMREAENAALVERAAAMEELRRNMHETISDLRGSIRVFCRVRPAGTLSLAPSSFGGDERRRRALVAQVRPSLQAAGAPPTLVRLPSTKENLVEPTVLDLLAPEAAHKGGATRFKFDRVFDERASQEDVFSEVSQLTQSAIDGFKVCIFAHGQTGSGKTHTMEGVRGGAPEQQGVIPRAAAQVFGHCAQLELLGWSFDFQASFLEIYNEELRDLLPPKEGEEAKPKLDIVHSGGETHVPGLRSCAVASTEQLAVLLAQANKVRSTASTKCNEHSSRSHYLFRMRISGRNTRTREATEGELNLVRRRAL